MELKVLPPHLNYVFLEEDDALSQRGKSQIGAISQEEQEGNWVTHLQPQ